MTNLLKAFTFTLFLLLTQLSYSQPAGSVGVIDARNWPIDKSPFAIVGHCHSVQGQLLKPEECQKAVGEISNFPELWKDNEAGLGYATYSLVVLLPQDHAKSIALALPQMYSSYKMWANGKLAAQNGTVGKSIKDCIPQWMPQTVSIEVSTDSLNLVLQIANFHHAKGGIKEPIYLGTEPLMHSKRSIAKTSNLTEATVLFLLGSFFLFIFFSRQTKKVTLYFALLCMTWSVRS